VGWRGSTCSRESFFKQRWLGTRAAPAAGEAAVRAVRVVPIAQPLLAREAAKYGGLLPALSTGRTATRPCYPQRWWRASSGDSTTTCMGRKSITWNHQTLKQSRSLCLPPRQQPSCGRRAAGLLAASKCSSRHTRTGRRRRGSSRPGSTGWPAVPTRWDPSTP